MYGNNPCVLVRCQGQSLLVVDGRVERTVDYSAVIAGLGVVDVAYS